MSVAFSSSAEDALQRSVDIGSSFSVSKSENIIQTFELQRCADWIKTNRFQRVALQFPDELLKHAVEAVKYLDSLVEGTKLYILGDTSFGSCCLDEVAAHHASCEAVVHFGHSCLSGPTTLKALLILGLYPVDWTALTNKLQEEISLKDDVLVFVDAKYSSHLEKLEQLLPKSFIIGKPILPGDDLPIEGCQIILKRVFQTDKDLNSESKIPILWIGEANRAFTNLVLYFSSHSIFSYNPETETLQQEGLTISKSLMRRHYLVEKAKDAQIIGILIGTLGVKNFREVIVHLRTLIKKSGKRSYTLAVGKLNVAKLANFQEIDIFVYVACPENTFFDSKEFYRPVITPYELEVALNPGRSWGAQYFTDFDDILPGGKAHVELPEDFDTEREYDISLISGRLRGIGGGCGESEETCAENEIGTVTKKEQTVSIIHSRGAGDALSQRSWQGLNLQLNETPVATMKQGRDGIAMGYSEEGQNKSSIKPDG